MTDDLNLKISLIWTILIFMSNFNFMLSQVEHGKSFITFGLVANPGNRFSLKKAQFYFFVISTCT